MTSKEATKKRLQTMRARRAAYLKTTQPGYDGAEATRAARAASWQRLEAEVDPEGALSAEERRKRAVRLWQAKMYEGRIRNTEKRLRRAS